MIDETVCTVDDLSPVGIIATIVLKEIRAPKFGDVFTYVYIDEMNPKVDEDGMPLLINAVLNEETGYVEGDWVYEEVLVNVSANSSEELKKTLSEMRTEADGFAIQKFQSMYRNENLVAAFTGMEVSHDGSLY